ncbi:hypothetical protein IJM16_03235 [Candidatus Saccharibacteria bacterium]|nr:hypothetical protein [Candidatus Saccharibacteria bacterium]
MSKKILLIGICAILSLTLRSGGAFAEENYFTEIEKDLVDGALIVKADGPEVDPNIFEVVYGNIYYKYGYDIEWDWEVKDYHHITLVKYGEAHEVTTTAPDGSWSSTDLVREKLAEKTIEIKYTGVDSAKKSVVNSLITPIAAKNSWNSDDWNDIKRYIVDDLSFVNFFVAGYHRDASLNSNELKLIADRMANFSPQYKKDFDNKNVQLVIDNRAGDGGPFLEETMGFASVVSEGYIYDVIPAVGARTIREIFIPSSIEDTKEAYVAAVQKRIDDYYEGTSLAGKVRVSYGGPICDIVCDFEEDGLMADPDFRGDSYFLLSYEGSEVDFIIQKNDDRITTPSFATGDITTNVAVTSDDPTIPLDTIVVVNKINKKDRADTINKLGLAEADIYDINLHSDAANRDITKLPNGKFLVRVPVDSKYEGKELAVYYIDVNGKVEQFEVTVNDGYAEFVTNHFSEYILGTSEGTQANPGTLDVIQYALLIAIGCGFIIATNLKNSARRR